MYNIIIYYNIIVHYVNHTDNDVVIQPTQDAVLSVSELYRKRAPTLKYIYRFIITHCYIRLFT